MVVSKKDMAARAAQAARMAPSIEDRLQQARELVGTHPVDESGPSSLRALAVQSVSPTDMTTSGAMPTARQIAMVPLDLIDVNPFNARRIYRPERVNELAASIGAHGQESPGIAPERDGRYVLVAGHYRLRALKVVGAPTMAVMLHPGLSNRELYALSYRENAEREEQSSLDNAMAWRELLDQGVYASETEIAEATGMSLPNINKTLAALRLTPSTLDIVKEAPSHFALSVLYELALYEAAAGTVKAGAMARAVSAGEAGRKEIQEARAQLETPKARKRKETSRQYKIQQEGVPIGLLKEWDSGKVILEVTLADPKDRNSLISELRARFGLND